MRRRVLALAAVAALMAIPAAYGQSSERPHNRDAKSQQSPVVAEPRERRNGKLEAGSLRAIPIVHQLAPRLRPSPQGSYSYTGPIPDLIRWVFGDNPDAMAVLLCENPRLDPHAVNGRVAGLWQIDYRWATGEWPNPFAPFDRFDPIISTRFAFWISKGGTDWWAWAHGDPCGEV